MKITIKAWERGPCAKRRERLSAPVAWTLRIGLTAMALLAFRSAPVVAVPVARYAAPSGTPTGDGTITKPWDIATALSKRTVVQPGDTIWLRGGRYTIPAGGSIRCTLKGTASAPINVAQYPGERATLDIKGSARGLYFSQYPAVPAYVNFRDFEITTSDTNRVAGKPVAIFVSTSDHLKFINLVIHDTGEGFYLSPSATNTEVYGCIVFYNGAKDGIEHGIYIQNVSGYKKAVDNIVFNNAGFGIHAYAPSSDAALLNVSLVGNISFNNGQLGPSTPHPDLMLGGASVAITPIIDGNATYRAAPPATLWNQMIGGSAGCASPAVNDNYFVGTTVFTNCTSSLTMTGNTYYGAVLTRPKYGDKPTSLSKTVYYDNTFLTARPTNAIVVVRPNVYQAGRANIAVYNWGLKSSVDVDVDSALNPGDSYEIRDALNYFGTPVLSSVYNGSPISLPMIKRTPSKPVGFAAPPPSGPEFQAFVLLKRP